MKLVGKLIGVALLLLAIYLLGQNIYISTNPYRYWWRGVTADACILFLTAGFLMSFVLPVKDKLLSYAVIGVGILLVFASNNVVLNSTSIWQFLVSLASFSCGYQLFTKGHLNI